MVDINTSHIPSVNGTNFWDSSVDLSLDDLDYLENIDESDLLNFSSCDTFSLYPDTPPETPDNYSSNGQTSSLGSPHSTVSTISLTDNYSLPESSNYSTVNSNHINLSTIADTCNNNAMMTQVFPQTTIVQSPATITTCISPLLLNCQPVLSTVDLNEFRLNGSSLKFSPSINTSCITTNSYQPKPILPSQISPKLTEKQKELIQKQKAEARKLKNREAALNSRKKKQDYVENLETNVKQLTKERDALLVENKVLKTKVKDLENQLCNRLRLDINGNYEANKKAKLSMFAVVCMLCFQVSPYIISMSPSGNSNLTDITSTQLATLPKANSLKVGRTLLWKPDPSDASPDYYDIDSNNVKRFNTSSDNYANMSVICKDYFNVTESQRLENELRDWLTRFKLEEKSNASKRRTKTDLKAKPMNNKKLLFDSKYVPIPRLKLWMQKQKYNDYIADDFAEERAAGAGSGEVYGFDYENVLSTVHRRDDTFYYLSYPSKGHLILPPISNRTDVRPRFSFLIPTFNNLSLDGSHNNAKNNLNHSISSQMFVLQIDCQVINTKVTMIKVDENGFSSNKTDTLAPNKSTNTDSGKKVNNSNKKT